MRTQFLFGVTVVVILSFVVGPTAALATTITGALGPVGTFTAATDDLIEAGQPTLSGVTVSGTLLAGSVDLLNDGSVYSGYADTDGAVPSSQATELP